MATNTWFGPRKYISHRYALALALHSTFVLDEVKILGKPADCIMVRGRGTSFHFDPAPFWPALSRYNHLLTNSPESSHGVLIDVLILSPVHILGPWPQRSCLMYSKEL
jgi:hypothetical protein